ncbi:MAG: ABC transporter permease [Spirochaetota bacterium]
MVRPRVFLSYDIYFAFMSSIPFTAIMALALTPVIIAGEIDLSFPSIMGFGGLVFTNIFTGTGDIYLAIVLCLVAGALQGALNGLIITKIRIPSLIATIGTMYFWRGIMLVLCGGKGTPLVAARDTFLFNVLVGRLTEKRIPMQALWTVVILIFLWLLLNKHRFGARIYHVGDNVVSARMMGINSDRVKTLVFLMMGLFAAFAGVLASLEVTYLWPTLGEGYLIKVVASVFVGGTSISGGEGTLIGTFIGVVIIGCLEAGIVAMGLTGFWTQAVYGAVIVISLSFYSLIRRGS